MSKLRTVRSAALAFGVSFWLSAPVEATELVMVEQVGCAWCARFDADVAPEYSITPEGLVAPLRRIDLHLPLPADLRIAGPLVITPTFLLVIDGAEVARLEGYPGEDFFWGLLGRMLADAGLDITTPEANP
jgi:hypothetical protein